MPRNSSGVYLLPASDVNPPVFNQPIDPIAYAAEMQDIANELTNSLDRLGRSPMQAILAMAGFRISNVGAPVAQTDAARLADFGGYLPPGAIQDFAMNMAPSGWLVCDGTSYATSAQSNLFAAIGYTWGGSGANFNVPDFRGTSRRTWDNGKGLDPSRVFGSYQADMFGSHTHTQAPHSHTATDSGHTHPRDDAGGFGNATFGGAQSLALQGAGTTGIGNAVITVANATATNNATGGAETVGKNYAVLTCIRT
jgi:microcystin-dependent protein